MKLSKFGWSGLTIGFLLGVTTVACIGAIEGGDKSENVQNIEENDEVKVIESYQQLIKDNYQVYALPIPESPSFAGEKVPVDNLLVKESLDKELHSNTYWHSNTFFYFKRANRWFPIIEPILKDQGVPDDFKYLAVIESGLLDATSPSGAKGFWQFMKSTAENHGMEINEDVDERYHLEKATIAACEYLKQAFQKFGNWTLAAASYNMGKAGVQNQLDGQEASNYYDLRLNAETARYVYRIVAVKYILSSPENYGFHLRQEDLYPPYETITLQVDSSISDLVKFASSQGTNYKIIKALNPWLRSKKLTNKSGKIYEILIPKKNTGLDVIES